MFPFNLIQFERFVFLWSKSVLINCHSLKLLRSSDLKHQRYVHKKKIKKNIYMFIKLYRFSVLTHPKYVHKSTEIFRCNTSKDVFIKLGGPQFSHIKDMFLKLQRPSVLTHQGYGNKLRRSSVLTRLRCVHKTMEISLLTHQW
jgi:hypothetical protein